MSGIIIVYLFCVTLVLNNDLLCYSYMGACLLAR